MFEHAVEYNQQFAHGRQDRDNCPLISKETERGASDPEITYTARRDGIHYLLISGVGGEIGTYTVEVR